MATFAVIFHSDHDSPEEVSTIMTNAGLTPVSGPVPFQTVDRRRAEAPTTGSVVLALTFRDRVSQDEALAALRIIERAFDHEDRVEPIGAFTVDATGEALILAMQACSAGDDREVSPSDRLAYEAAREVIRGASALRSA